MPYTGLMVALLILDPYMTHALPIHGARSIIVRRVVGGLILKSHKNPENSVNGVQAMCAPTPSQHTVEKMVNRRYCSV